MPNPAYLISISSSIFTPMDQKALRALGMTRIAFLWIALFYLVSFPSHGLCADPSSHLLVSFDRKTASVGEVVTLVLKAPVPGGRCLPDNVEIKGIEGLFVVSRKILCDTVRIRLLVDRLDKLVTGKLSLTWVDKEGKRHESKAPPVFLKVKSTIGEKPEDTLLRPIRGIIPERPLWLKILPWGILALCMLAALICAFLWWLRHKKEPSPVKKETLPPHVWAAEELERLERSGLYEEGRLKEYYFILSSIIKRYIEAIRGFPAAEFTTEEIAKTVKEEEDRKMVRLLKEADMVKFSNAYPDPGLKEGHVAAFKSYIERTRPVTDVSSMDKPAETP